MSQEAQCGRRLSQITAAVVGEAASILHAKGWRTGAEEEGSIGDRRIKVRKGGGKEAGVMWRR